MTGATVAPVLGQGVNLVLGMLKEGGLYAPLKASLRRERHGAKSKFPLYYWGRSGWSRLATFGKKNSLLTLQKWCVAIS